jgi:hypothetical protein
MTYHRDTGHGEAMDHSTRNKHWLDLNCTDCGTMIAWQIDMWNKRLRIWERKEHLGPILCRACKLRRKGEQKT